MIVHRIWAKTLLTASVYFLVLSSTSGQETTTGRAKVSREENRADRESGRDEKNEKTGGTDRSDAEPSEDERIAEGAEPTLDPEEIRRRRYFRSRKTSLYRVLEIPKYVLEIPWYPVKEFLDFSERTDLFLRVQDLFYFNDERTFGWFPQASFGGELGEGAGFSLFHHNLFDKDHDADFRFLFAGEDTYDLRAAYAIPTSIDNPYRAKWNVGFTRDEEVEIFLRPDPFGDAILGIDTDESDEVEFASRRFETRLTAGRTFAGEWDVEAYVLGEITKTMESDDFGALPASLSGFGEEIGLVGTGLSVAWDRRDDPVRPSSGWIVKPEFEAAIAPEKTDQGNRFSYTSYSLDAQFFLPLYAPHRVLVFRQYFRRVDPLGGNELAFFHLPILDVHHGLRSFERNRFRDNGVLLSSVEYRYPVWKTWDAFLFVDGGQTFDEYSDIELGDYEYSGGGGIRFMNKDRLLFQLQVGFGSEGSEVIFSLEQLF